MALLVLLSGCGERGQPAPTEPAAAPDPLPAAAPGALHLSAPPEPPSFEPFPVPPDRDLAAIARRLRPSAEASATTLPGYLPGTPAIGHEESFWVIDLQARQAARTTATLRRVTPNALWYVDDRVTVGEGNLDSAAQAFEDRVYPGVTQALGAPDLPPGVRLAILHTRIQGAQAYVSSADRYPPEVHPYTNRRPMLYVNVPALTVGSPTYNAVVAHELQHLIHGLVDPAEEGWVNEGLSELASQLAGYRQPRVPVAGREGVVSLTHWPDSSPRVGQHYAAVHSFFSYLHQHYAPAGQLRLLLQEPAGGIRGIEAYLARQGAPATFRQVFGHWTVANLLGADGPGRYGYTNALETVSPVLTLGAGESVDGSLAPFATSYVRLLPSQSAASLRFKGQPSTSVIPEAPFSGERCWWSNRGDSIHSRLTRELDLTGVGQATLEFQAWYDIERSWDYAYVIASADDGRTWDVLPGQHTQAGNPLGNSFGPGLTGASFGWTQEAVSLTPYAGRRVRVSFEYVTDDAVNLDGLCIDDIRVPEIDFFDDAESDAGWQAEGFVRTDNTVIAQYQVFLVEVASGGGPHVQEMTLGPDNTGQLPVDWSAGDIEEAFVVLSSVTPVTSQPVSYSLSLSKDGG